MHWAEIASDDHLLASELATMQEAAEATSLTLESIKAKEGKQGGDNLTPRAHLTRQILTSMAASKKLDAGVSWDVVKVRRGEGLISDGRSLVLS